MAFCSLGISQAGSNGLLCPLPSLLSPMKWQRVKSAPLAASLGVRVSLGSSSPLHISTLPARARWWSGHTPPMLTVAANAIARVVFPCPGAPAKICSLPAASHSFHSHLIGFGCRLDAGISATLPVSRWLSKGTGAGVSIVLGGSAVKPCACIAASMRVVASAWCLRSNMASLHNHIDTPCGGD